MAIITISRGSYSMGKAVAEKVAETLGYTLISRDLLLNASEKFRIPQQKLLNAIHDAPGLFERYHHTKQIYMAYIRSALVEMVAGDNVVYHGLAGHLLLNRLDHVLKIRIISNIEGRVAKKMKEDGLTEQAARIMIREDDEHRRKWTRKIYATDPRDNSLYDMVICIDKLSVDNAADSICGAAATKAFTSTDSTRKKIQDLALACNVKAALVEEFPYVGVTCEYGNVLLYSTDKEARQEKLKKIVASVKQNTQKIYNFEIHTGVPIPADVV